MVVCVVVYLQSEAENHQVCLVYSMPSNFVRIFVVFCIFFGKNLQLVQKEMQAVHNV